MIYSFSCNRLTRVLIRYIFHLFHSMISLVVHEIHCTVDYGSRLWHIQSCRTVPFTSLLDSCGALSIMISDQLSIMISDGELSIMISDGELSSNMSILFLKTYWLHCSLCLSSFIAHICTMNNTSLWFTMIISTSQATSDTLIWSVKHRSEKLLSLSLNLILSYY